jgi:dihydrofolate reductase
MGNVVLYIAASLDGYIADRDGGVGWLEPFQAQGYGYDAFLETVGTVIMGRATYEQIPTFGVSWPYAGKKAIVFTHRTLPLFDPSVEFYAGDPAPLVGRVESTSEKKVWLVGGAALITTFMNAALVDEMRLFVMPAFVGQGIPLFQDITLQPVLALQASVAYPNGVAELQYTVRPSLKGPSAPGRA